MSNDTKPPASRKKSRRKTAAPDRVRRRDILILLAIWVVGCALVGGLVGLFYLYSSPSEPEPLPAVTEQVNITFSGGSAKAAYLEALADAQTWRDDAALVSVSAAWDNATPEALGEVGGWNFSFYSPTQQRMYLELVAAGQPPIGRAHPFKLDRPAPVIAPESWVVDSDEALSVWINSGGNAFLRAFPENQVEALLRHAIEQERPVWNIIGTSADQSQLFFLTIDAETGAVLNRN